MWSAHSHLVTRTAAMVLSTAVAHKPLLLLIVLVLSLVTVQSIDFQHYAEKYAPLLLFDKKEGNSERCFPSNAEEYYDMRVSGINDRVCNQDYSSIFNNEVPVYWHAMTCGYHLHIAYWTFFGFNHKCDAFNGERNAWWEFMVVKVRDWELGEHLHEVMFGQKGGWYTRIPGHYQVFNVTHPMAYVGKNNHGFYHDDGGSGTCCYFEDYRNPGSSNHRMFTWENLEELDPSANDTWMGDPSPEPWSGLTPPTFRSDWDLCKLVGCTGSSLQICGTCGCHKSDIDDSPF